MSTRALLVCGVAAGPLYIIVGLAQMLTREDFDIRLHALSLLSNGDFGWIQIANFLLSGALVIAGATGMRRLLHSRRGGVWGPILLGAYGVGLIGAGVFVADPGRGFPPGTPMEPTGITSAGVLHFVFGGNRLLRADRSVLRLRPTLRQCRPVGMGRVLDVYRHRLLPRVRGDRVRIDVDRGDADVLRRGGMDLDLALGVVDDPTQRSADARMIA